MKWEGPFEIEYLLRHAAEKDCPRPPVSASVYVITKEKWKDQPDQTLYIGGNTHNSGRFRTRIGDLIADLFGFFGNESPPGHHSGGRSLYRYCQREKISPLNLYIGWLAECECGRCAEGQIFEALKPMLNKNKPALCKIHNADLFKIKEPLMIIHPKGGKRPMDYVFKTPTGICFFDDGWSETSGHPIHFVDGEIKGGDPWVVGDSRIEIMTDRAMLDNHAKWVGYKKANGITRAKATKTFKEILRQMEEMPTDAEGEVKK